MSTDKKSTQVATYLASLTPAQMVEDEKVADKFVALYNNVHGAKNGELFYHKEKFNLMKMVAENPTLKECSSLSLYGCFLDVAVNGLSFEGGSRPLAYVTTRNCNIGPKNEPVWEKRAQLVVSPYGELLMRMRSGQIKYADNPVVVYQNDKFSIKNDAAGNKMVEFEMTIPRTSTKIIGAFIKIVRMDGSVDFQYLLEDDIKRLSGYSAKQNKGTANALYTSNDNQIDPGFLAAKMIKHAFKTYPKVRTGQFTEMETQIEEQPQVIDYGIPLQDAAVINPESNTESFMPDTMPQTQVEATVIHEDQDDTF